ncbi:hypothetical protein ATCC90586_002539 [Pythium insidiosum]|nr:hypothetical protein ATCC90586_002539 [Pythium insidiosum]
MDEERAVLLGVVQEKTPVDGSSPTVCKAGGRPAWYSASPVVDPSSLDCPKCKAPLYLVAQVYAPVESDRTLYIFGCNSADCTETPGSWRVFRDQASRPVASSVAPPAVAPEAEVKPASAWDAGGDDDSDWSNDDEDADAKGSAVGVATGSASNPLGDLELLLQQRDAAMSSSSARVATPAKSHSKPDEARHTGDFASNKSPAFPALFVDVVDEPFEDFKTQNDFSHENELLQQYMRQEEEDKSTDYMRQEEEDKSTDVNDLRRIIANAKKSDGSVSGSAAASSGESYERTPAQQKHFMRFQKRINRCPLQVLRYDYGGEPLWPKPMPRSLKIPPCPCGEARAFELQLTPTINYFLKVDEFAAKQLQIVANATSAAPTAATGGGMDWSSVVVYSCPLSCAYSHEEHVIVLPASSQ